jgi:hypothetical protein
VCGLTGHERTLRTRLAEIQASDGPTKVPEAIALGNRLLADAKHGRVIVLSDGCFKESEKLTGDERVELRAVGTRAANVGITNFQVRRSLLDPIGYEILTEVTNASEETVECRLDIDLNELPVDVIPLTLAPGQTWSKAIEKTSVDGGRLTARIDYEDALAVDNAAVALLPKRREQRVVLVSEGNLFLRKALEVNALVKLETTAAMPEKYEPSVLYVFHRKVPEEMPAGSVWVIDPVAGTDLWELGEKLENPIVTKQDSDSPLMRHVRLDNVLLPEARQLTPAEGAKPLVTALSGDPLYFSSERAEQKVLVLTVNLDQGDLTFRTAFPIMATNALGWFAGQSGELRESLASGAVSEVALPAAAAGTLEFQSPTGKMHALPEGAEKAAVGPLDECGVWKVVAGGANDLSGAKSNDGIPTHSVGAPMPTTLVELACNLANREESDLRVPEVLLKAQPGIALAGGWFARPVWLYLIAAAWVLASVEWFLYQRRWIS